VARSAILGHKEHRKAGIYESGMDAKLQRRVQRYGWDKAAPHYERSWQAQLEPAQSALLEMADLAPGERVLDVACGTGLVTLKAASLVAPGGKVVGTDISEEMVVAARSIARTRRVTNVTFERMDAEELAFDDCCFDAALCALGLMYVPDPEKAVGELHRVLKPGGRAACAVWGQRSKCGWAEIFSIVDSRVHSEVCPMFFRLGTGEALLRAFQSAGFGAITCRRLETRLDYATPTEACEAAFAGGPVALAYSRFSDATKAEAQEEYLASLEAYRVGNGYEVPGEFVVLAGTK
jgi:ubiquinone/menaquinone biosynthesis C-methylase UbiE